MFVQWNGEFHRFEVISRADCRVCYVNPDRYECVQYIARCREAEREEARRC